MSSATAIRQMAEYKTMGWTELVTYHPYNHKAKTIDALIDRGQVANEMNILVDEVTITVLNDEIEGIAPQLMDRGADQIDVAARHGAALQNREIQRIVSQNEDWVTLAVI